LKILYIVIICVIIILVTRQKKVRAYLWIQIKTKKTTEYLQLKTR